MNTSEYYSLQEQALSVQDRIQCIMKNQQIGQRPHMKLSELFYHLNQSKSTADRTEQKFHMNKSKRLLHELKYQYFIQYRLKCIMKNILKQ